MMGMIKKKWVLETRHREKLEPEYKCFGEDKQDIENVYDLKYFLLNRNLYSIEYLYNILSVKCKNFQNYIYKTDKQLYYNIISWPLFKEWIDIYINNIYPKYSPSFDIKTVRTKKQYKKYLNE